MEQLYRFEDAMKRLKNEGNLDAAERLTAFNSRIKPFINDWEAIPCQFVFDDDGVTAITSAQYDIGIDTRKDNQFSRLIGLCSSFEVHGEEDEVMVFEFKIPYAGLRN